MMKRVMLFLLFFWAGVALAQQQPLTKNATPEEHARMVYNPSATPDFIKNQVNTMSNEDFARMEAYRIAKNRNLSPEEASNLESTMLQRANTPEMLQLKAEKANGGIFHQNNFDAYQRYVAEQKKLGNSDILPFDDFSLARQSSLESGDDGMFKVISPETQIWDVDGIIDEFIKAGFDISENLAGVMQKTLFLLMVIVFIYRIMMTVLKEGDLTDVMTEIIEMVMLFGLAVWLMETSFYRDVVNGFAVEAPRALMTHMSSTGSSTPVGDIARRFSAMATASMAQIRYFTIIDLLFQQVNVLLLLILLFFIFTFCALACLITYVLAYFAIAIGVAIGPLMIPWMIWQPSRFVFEGWYTFLISAMFQVLAINIVVVICSTLLDAYGANPEMVGVQNTSVSGFTALCLITMYCTYVITKTPGLANGLIGGGIRMRNFSVTGAVSKALTGMKF